MTNDELAALLVRSQSLLAVDGDRVQPGALEFRDIETIAKLCVVVVKQASAGNTVADLALERLAVTTAAALTTIVFDTEDNVAIVADWLAARAEYTELAGQ